MKKLIFLFACVLSFGLQAQVYKPSQHYIASTATGYSNATPADARSQFFDSSVFKYRDYQSLAEAKSYLNLSKYRSGHFPVFIHSGGTLTSGVWTGGTTNVYYFRDGTADANLVRQDSAISAVNIIPDATHRFVTDAEKATWNAGGTWGAITGTLSAQADLNSALTGKQATLVSGTNIKTINGIPLLGSGNVTIAAGGKKFCKISCFGDSKTYGSSLVDSAHSWPAMLRKLYGGQVDVANYGSGGSNIVSYGTATYRTAFDTNYIINVAIWGLGTNDFNSSLYTAAQADTNAKNVFKLMTDTLGYKLIVIVPAETGHGDLYSDYDVHTYPNFQLFADYLRRNQVQLKISGLYDELSDPKIGQYTLANVILWTTPDTPGTTDRVHLGQQGDNYKVGKVKNVTDQVVYGNSKYTLEPPLNWTINNRVHRWLPVYGAVEYEIIRCVDFDFQGHGQLAYRGGESYFVDSGAIGQVKYYYSLQAKGPGKNPSPPIYNDSLPTGGNANYYLYSTAAWRTGAGWVDHGDYAYKQTGAFPNDTSICMRIGFTEGYKFVADGYGYDGGYHLFRVYDATSGALLDSYEVSIVNADIGKVIREYHSNNTNPKLLYIGRGATAVAGTVIVRGVITYAHL